MTALLFVTREGEATAPNMFRAMGVIEAVWFTCSARSLSASVTHCGVAYSSCSQIIRIVRSLRSIDVKLQRN